jgi:NAD(P)-dependent dehydrogenase (short-subunit alcohol dehydrogenase family)
MKKLEGKTALITGGTTGIGFATAKLFAAEGAMVTITGTNRARLEAAHRALGDTVKVVASDAGSRADTESLARRYESTGLDVLFLNAGIAKLGSIVEMDEAAFDETLRINLKGPWLGIKCLSACMRRGGAIVVTSSINGQIGMIGTSAYAASKAALRSLVRVAAAELAPAGVRVNAVGPGPVTTPLYEKLGLMPEAAQVFSRELVAKVPLGRFATPEEIAKSVLFLASDDSVYMTGEEIIVDGGLTRV